MPYKDPQKRRAQQKEYWAANKDKFKDRTAAYRIAHREKLNANSAKARLNKPLKYLLRAAQTRAAKTGREFTVTEADISWPERCPVLGLTLQMGGGQGYKDNSPSLDRIDNSKGYVPGNVIVVSHRANAIKRDATLAELRLLLEFYERLEAGHG